MLVVKVEVESVLVNPVDMALQLMTVESGSNNNPLELIIAVKCEQKTHIPTHGGKGLFFVRGSRLLTARCSQKTLWPSWSRQTVDMRVAYIVASTLCKSNSMS